jgi:apolipoprotein N-acyltransferase
VRLSLLCGFVFGCFLLFWMPQTLKTYSGANLFLGITGMIFLAFLLSLWFAFIFLLFSIIQIKDGYRNRSVVVNMILFATIFYLVEFLHFHSLPGLVWNKFFLAGPLSSNVYMIQLASVTGSLGIGILVAAVNYLIANSIIHKKMIFVIIAAGIFFSNLGYGIIVFNMEDTNQSESRIVGVICENIEAETRWTESGDAIINTMLNLVHESTRYDPEILIWSETALPWTYIDDDDILIAISGIIQRSNVRTQNIIGYLSDVEQDTVYVYNSAYLIDADGKAIDRIDKRRLLTFFEEPLIRNYSRTAIPMLTQSIYNNVKRGAGKPILNTNAGRAWVMICNESLLPYYFGHPQKTPDYLVNMSNDAWLENTQNIAHHFYLARLRAVEYRKDMIINSNRGMSGFISANGKVVSVSQSDRPELIIGHITPNSNHTFYSRFPMLIPILNMLVFCIVVFYNFTKRIKTQSTKST